MARKLIIDCDPGIGDAVALAIALFDPRLEVVAVTATGGSVPVEQTSRNLQAIIERLDPPRLPRLGYGSEPESGPATDARHINGPDGLANLNLAVSQLHHRHAADKIICDEVRAAPEEITFLALGPLTNLAHAFRRDPTLPAMMGQIIILGGAVEGVGNVTPSAEFNIFTDPEAAREVFRSATTKTLIPLDVTNQVTFSIDLIEKVSSESSRVGALLGQLLPYYFRSHRAELGQEVVSLAEAVAVVATSDPELFETEPQAGDVEIAGELTLGATVFDRRQKRQWRVNMEVASALDTEAVAAAVVRGLKNACEKA